MDENKPNIIQQLLAAKIKMLEQESTLLGDILSILSMPKAPPEWKKWIESWQKKYDKIQKGES